MNFLRVSVILVLLSISAIDGRALRRRRQVMSNQYGQDLGSVWSNSYNNIRDNLRPAISATADRFSQNLNQFGQNIGQTWNQYKENIGQAWDQYKPNFNQIGQTWNGYKQNFNQGWNQLQQNVFPQYSSNNNPTYYGSNQYGSDSSANGYPMNYNYNGQSNNYQYYDRQPNNGYGQMGGNNQFWNSNFPQPQARFNNVQNPGVLLNANQGLGRRRRSIKS